MTRSKTKAKKKAQQAPSQPQQQVSTEDAVLRNGNVQQQQQQYRNSIDHSHSQSHSSAHPYAQPHHHHHQHAHAHAQNGFASQPIPSHPNSHSHSPSTHTTQPAPSQPELTEAQKKMVPISDKALAMLNHMLGNRGMMQRDPSTGAIDVVLNTELFPNLTLPFPALEIPSKGSGDPEEDIRDVLQKVAGGALGGIVGMPGAGVPGQGQAQMHGQTQQQQQQHAQQVIGNAFGAGLGVGPGGKLPNLEDLLKLPIFQTGT
jgi:hypothetical protein